MSRPYCVDPEILYDAEYIRGARNATQRIAGLFNLQTTDEIVSLWFRNMETRRIISHWRNGAGDLRPAVHFQALWVMVQGNHAAFKSPEPPQIGTINVSEDQYATFLKGWCAVQLIRAVPGLFPRSNASTTPMIIEAYDLCNATLVLSWARGHRLILEKRMTGRRQIPVQWYDPANILPVQTDVAPTIGAATGSSNRVPEHDHHTPKGDTISPPVNDSDINTRGLLYEFACKLCEQFQHKVRVTIEPVNSEKDENGKTLFSGVDELVDQYAQTMERSGNPTQKHKSGVVLGDLANHCARMGRLPQVEKSIGEIEGEKTRNTVQRSRALPKRRNTSGYNGIVKERAAQVAGARIAREKIGQMEAYERSARTHSDTAKTNSANMIDLTKD